MIRKTTALLFSTLFLLTAIAAHAQTGKSITPQLPQQQALSNILWHFPVIWSGQTDTLRAVNDSAYTGWIKIGMTSISSPNDWEIVARHLTAFTINIAVDMIDFNNGNYSLECYFVARLDTNLTRNIVNADTTNFFAKQNNSSNMFYGIYAFDAISRTDGIYVAYPLRILQPCFVRFVFKVKTISNTKIRVRWILTGYN